MSWYNEVRFESLEVGDKVIVKTVVPSGHDISRTFNIEHTVARVMKSQFVLENGERYMLDSGRQVKTDKFASAKGSAFPVGYMEKSWGKEPTPLKATPQAEIDEFRAVGALLSEADVLFYKIYRSSKALGRVRDNPDDLAKLKDALPWLKELAHLVTN